MTGRWSRRSVLGLGAVALAARWPGARAEDAREIEAHGISAFDDPRYPADFRHFTYVNPDAPKGGLFSTIPSTRAFNQTFLTFNSLNSFILKGDGAHGMELTFASLMARAYDEPDAMYGLAAQSVTISADRTVYRFTMRKEARFHDGTPLTAQDAAFSLNILKEKGHPIIRQQMRDVVGAVAADDATLIVTFAPRRGRDVPLFVASLPIFSKAYYATQAFEESTLAVPLGCGPYKVARVEVGRVIEFERVADWWGAELPVARGRFNFERLRFEYYRDRDAAFVGFTSRNYLYREEFTARVWATRYDFPAVNDGRVKRETLPDRTASGAQGWFINMRRERFKDARVREALIHAFDFEWTNKTIMYGAYARTHSPFQNSDMMAEGPPSEAELKLLEPFRERLPAEVFGAPFVPPVSDGTGQDRALLRRASQLLNDAGLVVKDRKRRLPNGDIFRIEFLLDEPSFEPHHMPYIKNLGALGIEASLRIVDPVQYRARLDDFDFDMTVVRFGMSATPGDGLRTYFSSQAAAIKGSQNLSGIADPVLDALIDRIIAADSREALTTACRAFDRVFRAGRYWVPQWYRDNHPIAYWDVFDHPPELPRYLSGVGTPDLWWAKPGAAAGATDAGK
ncbi:MAG: extracellular solute-binding protein [Xanthobacteraceae bacterium]